MSIINDALKKAEKERTFSQDKAVLIPQRRSLKTKVLFAATALTALVGTIFAFRYLQHPTDKNNAAESVFIPERVAQVPEPREAFYQKKIDTDSASPHISDFHLTGIIYDELGPLAIINNRIVGKGALIEGAEILEIQANFVKLSNRGKEFILKVK